MVFDNIGLMVIPLCFLKRWAPVKNEVRAVGRFRAVNSNPTVREASARGIDNNRSVNGGNIARNGIIAQTPRQPFQQNQ
jgi:hypothetical protein